MTMTIDVTVRVEIDVVLGLTYEEAIKAALTQGRVQILDRGRPAPAPRDAMNDGGVGRDA